MSEQELVVILGEIKRFGRGMREAVRQIAYLGGEIDALRSLMERKGLATPEELEAPTPAVSAAAPLRKRTSYCRRHTSR